MGKQMQHKKSTIKEIEENEKRQGELNRIKQAFARVAATEAGRDVLTFLMQECGFKKQSVVVHAATMDVNINSTLYNEARRGLYLAIRKFIPPKYLNLIEKEPESDDVENKERN